MGLRSDDRRRLAHGRRFWDLGTRLPQITSRVRTLQEPQWVLVTDTLGLSVGETVLDVGCGAGHALPALRAAVGVTGRVVALDYSPRALALASSVVAEHGWNNVELRLGDASATFLETATYDAAVASFSLSTVPDLDAAVARLYAALRPGGRVFVGDMHFGPHPGTRLLRRLYRGITGGNGDDVVAALRRQFDAVEPVVDKAGRALILPAGASWPPLAFVLTRKNPC